MRCTCDVPYAHTLVSILQDVLLHLCETLPSQLLHLVSSAHREHGRCLRLIARALQHLVVVDINVLLGGTPQCGHE